jgi:hypothetical protein
MDESKSSPSETETTALSRPLWSETSLHLAALTGQIEIAEILLVQGADVSKENSSGYDPLKYAAVGGFPELLILLLQHNADGDKASESDGNTALHLAVAYGHYKAAEILLQNTSDASKLIHTMNPTFLASLLSQSYRYQPLRRQICPTGVRRSGLYYTMAAATVLYDWACLSLLNKIIVGWLVSRVRFLVYCSWWHSTLRLVAALETKNQPLCSLYL